jgi:hypothetical protein
MTRPTIVLPLSIAALSFAIMLPASAQMGGQNGNMNSQNSGSSQQSHGMREAMRMVPARAFLVHDLSADKDQVGSEFQAKLTNKVQLHNGPELPAGTILVGKIANDDMNVSGTSKLALRFTEAKLKDGQTVPIKATIVGVTHGASYQPDGFSAGASSTVPNNWNDGTLAVDETDAFPGLELKSKIASKNSGVFVAKDKKNMTIGTNRELDLAIAQSRNGNNGMGGMNGMHCK